MTNNNNDFPYRAYAMEYGTFLGIAWTIVFFLYVGTFKTGNPLLSLITFCAFMALAFIPFFFAWRIKQMQTDGQSLGFMRGLVFSLNMFTFACLFSGVCEFIYFEFLDKGTLLESLKSIILTPETKAQYKAMGMQDTYSQLTDMFKEMQKFTALQKTELLFNCNFLVSMILFLPVSFISSLTPGRSRRGTYRQ